MYIKEDTFDSARERQIRGRQDKSEVKLEEEVCGGQAQAES